MLEEVTSSTSAKTSPAESGTLDSRDRMVQKSGEPASSLRSALGPLQQSDKPARIGCEQECNRGSGKEEKVCRRTGARMKS